MIIAAVGLGHLGLPRVELSEIAAVAWNSMHVVAAGSGGIPGRLFEKCGSKNSPTPQIIYRIFVDNLGKFGKVFCVLSQTDLMEVNYGRQ